MDLKIGKLSKCQICNHSPLNKIINLGTGKKVYLKKIALIISKKYKKKVFFSDNKNTTNLLANNNKLKKIYKRRVAK